MHLMITCHCCKGEGLIELTGDTALTYWELCKQKAEVTGADLAIVMGTAPTAMNNRLAKLEEFGLATSRRWGRKRLYKAKKSRTK